MSTKSLPKQARQDSDVWALKDLKREALHFVQHLRLPVQLSLSPFFLTGALIAALSLHGPRAVWEPFISSHFVWTFLVIHVGLYGGTTVFNSYYDQDEGPISGMLKPIPPSRWSLAVSIALQLLTLVLLSMLQVESGLIAGFMFVLGFLYSFPSVRLKKYPLGSLIVVAAGQGGLAALLGAAVVAGQADMTLKVFSDSWVLWMTAVGCTAACAGFYPMTQVFQIEEDQKRGDLTFAAHFGWKACFWMCGVATGLCGLPLLNLSLASLLLPTQWSLQGAGLLIASLVPSLPLWLYLGVWCRRFEDLSRVENHHWSFGLALGAACCVLFAMAALVMQIYLIH